MAGSWPWLGTHADPVAQWVPLAKVDTNACSTLATKELVLCLGVELQAVSGTVLIKS
jgi:hypothetical protein